MTWVIGRMLVIVMLISLGQTSAFADEAADAAAGTPAASEEVFQSSDAANPTETTVEEAPTVAPTEEPPVVATEPSTPDEAESAPDPSVATSESDDTASGGESLESAGTPTPVEEDPTPTIEPAIPFDPLLECLPREEYELAIAGEEGWALLACSLSWETRDVTEIEIALQPRLDGWTIRVLDEDEIDHQKNGPRSIQERIDASGLELVLSPLDSAEGDSGAFQSAEFLIGSRLGCSAPLSIVADLQISARSLDSDASEDRAELVEEVTEELAIQGRKTGIPTIQVKSLTFEPVANSLYGLVTSGNLSLTYSEAPVRCGWSISLTFSDFVAGAYVLPAMQLSATTVIGGDNLTVTSDQGVVTIVIPESETPRERDGEFQVSLELGLETFVPGGVYQTVVTVGATVSSRGE